MNLSDEATSEGQLSKPSGPQPAPRYDEVFFEGTAALDAEARGETTYPCARCGQPRTKDEGGTVFTVCDACWDAPSREED